MDGQLIELMSRGGSAPGGLPPGGASPIGGTPMTTPSANQGMQAAALAQVQWAVRLLEKSLPLLGAETEIGRDVAQALTKLAKHLSPGNASSGVANNALQQLMLDQRMSAPQQALMQQMGAQQQAAAPPAGAPPALAA